MTRFAMPDGVDRRAFLVAALAAATAIYPAGCEERPSATAYKIESLDQAVGGPVAYARIGDYVLKNDEIIVAIEGGHSSMLPLDVGGSIIDMDLVRHDKEFRGGKGLDQLGQIAAVANLGVARALNEGDVRITKSADGAEVTAAATTAGIQKIVDGIGVVIHRDYVDPKNPDKFDTRLYTEYQVRPGERFVRIVTTMGVGVPFCKDTTGCNPECDDPVYDRDCKCASIPASCTQGVKVVDADTLPDRPGGGLLDLFMGDLPRPLGTGKCTSDAQCNANNGEVCAVLTEGLGGDSRVCRRKDAKDAGIFMGDMLLFGGHLSTFVPGTGYDIETDIRRLFDKGFDTLATPLALPEIFATGDRVSYGYTAPKGQILVPVFGGPFSLGATAGIACRHDQPGCLEKTLVRFERWLSIGTGDVSSAREPLARARGDQLGKIKGLVLQAHTAKPVSGVQVFAIADPRALPCEGDCRTRCPAVEQVSNEELSRWTLEQLFAANRCRTRSATYLEGVAGIESVALTDPGTDRVKNGNYELVLPPGRHVLVAQRGAATRSPLAPVSVAAGDSATASIYLPEPGVLDYAVYDEKGKPTAARAIVGRCLPGKACQTDADCSQPAGELCQAGTCACQQESLRPLELGGGRLTDGTMLFDQTASGRGTIALPPGDYDVVFAHGPNAAVDKQRITIRENQVTVAQGVVRRVVDRRGWIAADFHVHAMNSLDSGLAMAERATSFLAEDMEFMSSSDHDTLTRYDNVLQDLGAKTRLGSHVGAETTTQELGHFIGYPLKYRERDADGNRLPRNDAPDWRNLTPGDIFSAIRAKAEDGVPFVLSVPHPYSYFDYYRLDPVSLESKPSILAILNPLLAGNNFSGEFDAMELINSKSLDLVRRPTASEVQFYSRGLDELIAAQRSGKIDEATYQRQFRNLATEATRRILHRTRAEQEAARTGLDAELECRCGSDGDCSAGLVCNPDTMTCGAPPFKTIGRPPSPVGVCRSSRGVIDDWFNMLNRGVRRAGVGGSDVHGLYGYEAGSPRTLLRTGATTPPHLGTEDVTSAILAFKSIVTNGPMIHFRVDKAEIGDMFAKPNNQDVALSVRVEKAPWFDVDRVEIYKNGELIHWATACEGNRRSGDDPEPHGHPCVRTGNHVIAYNDTIFDRPGRDAWYVVIALGLDGRPMSPVYSSLALSRFGTFEITQRLYDLIPALSALRGPRFPSIYPTFPIAITNPIWVDVDGDGWQPLAPATSWCWSKHDIGCGN